MTALSCRNGITVKAPPKVRSPAFSPSQKIVAVSDTEIAPVRTTMSTGTGPSECARRNHAPPFVQIS